MNRPKVDETKCFICQEVEPVKLVTRDNESFKICNGCLKALESELRLRKSLYRNDIFRMTLKMSLPPVLRVENLK